jgi:hypothetical protein
MLPPRGLAAQRPIFPKALDPDNRRTGTDLKLLGCLAPRSSAFHFRNHALTHVRRIGLRHRQPPKSESMPIDLIAAFDIDAIEVFVIGALGA